MSGVGKRSARIVKKLISLVLLAAVLWAVMFSPLTAPHVRFWWMMTGSALLLGLLSTCFNSRWWQRTEWNGANLLLTVQRDIKEDFIVCIVDVDTISSWVFAKIDGLATLLLLGMFAILAWSKNHLRVLCTLLLLSIAGMGTLSLLGAGVAGQGLPTTTWLFLQSLCLDMAYLSFQTIFFERFIACFKVRGNVGFFIITIDFVGYLGTLGLLLFKEMHAAHIDWPSFYDRMSLYIGLACCLAFVGALAYLAQARKCKTSPRPEQTGVDNGTIYLTTNAI